MRDMGRRWPAYQHHLGEQDWCRRRKQKVPRNYVSSLEAKVTELTKELEQLRKPQTQPVDDTPSSRSSSQASPVESATSPSDYQNWMTSNLGRVVCEPANHPHFFGVSSGITLARLVMSAIRVDDLPPSLLTRAPQQAVECSYSAATQATLPPRQAAEHLFDVYFQNRTPNFPVVSRSRAKKALDGAYDGANNPRSSSGSLPMNAFVTYMILAIALCSVRHSSGGRSPESENCFLAAVSVVEKVLYIALRPPKGSLWLLSGTALRLAVDLGMHWETEESKLRMDPETLNDRRRLWYSAYLFDWLLCITLGRPFGMADQGINVGLPVPPEMEADSHAARSQNSLIRLAKLQSEIKHVLYSQFMGSSLAYPRVNYALWLEDIKVRLQAWRDSIPPPSEAHSSSIFGSQAYWDAIYSEALLLYRPNPVQPQPSLEDLQVSLESSRRLIDCIKTLHRERRIDIMWKWVHHLFMAGLTTVYCLWHSRELRESVDIKTSVATLQSCDVTLSAPRGAVMPSRRFRMSR
ncbi:fungal specific transcription factor domain-containing protein [Colletotrichum plurivorum]|uniref:Fungal specific transcription factor domain-containing protein n=1 Tax=Colletotrichum plurivorum TaxID=2175906 RepID=A0A8H6KHG4_9PEZI|nr:fungal specific transcription factor domain-containing protein [Colletotrichum plurivorum]